MKNDGVSTSPAPGHNRRGGAGPEGPPDRIEKISVGDVLRDSSPEPPIGTEVELEDGERWKRISITSEWPLGVGQGQFLVTWAWKRVTFDGPVTVVWVPPPAADENERVKRAWSDVHIPGHWRLVTWQVED